MKEKSNIEDINQELQGFPKLKSLKGKKTFSVPDSYFDNLEDSIMSKIENEAVSTPARKFHLSTKQILYYVAAASIISIFIFIAFRSANQSTNQPPIAIQPNKTSNTNNPIVEVSAEDKKPEKNIAKKNDDETIQKVEPVDEKSIAIEENNTPINKVSNNKQKIHQNSLKSNITSSHDDTPEYELANNNQEFNGDISSGNVNGQAVSGGSINTINSNTSPSISVARAAIQKDLYLGDDICSSEPVKLNAFIKDIDSLKYKWSTDDTTAIITVRESGDYWVKVYDIKNNFLGSDTINVRIVNKPNPNLGADKSICNYESLLISSGCNNPEFDYQWSISDATTPEIYLTDMNPGVYTITLWVKSCADTISSTMRLTVNDCNLKIPNVITPNGDGQNDRFVISGLEHYPGSQLHILDRNGHVVFEAIDYQNNWDASNIPSGTYFYRLQLNDGKGSEKNGTLSIIR